MTARNELEPSILVSDAVTVEKEAKPSVLILKIVSFKVDILSQEDNDILTVEPVMDPVVKGVEPVVEDPLSSESVALEMESVVPVANSEMTTPTAVADKPEEAFANLPMGSTLPTSFFAITQGNHR